MAELLEGPRAGQSGLVPMNFIEKLPDDEANGVRSKLVDMGEVGGEAGEASADQDGPLGGARLYRVLYDYDPNASSPNETTDDELTIITDQILRLYGEPDEDGFYTGEHVDPSIQNGLQGFVPSNFVEPLSEMGVQEQVDLGISVAPPSQDDV